MGSKKRLEREVREYKLNNPYSLNFFYVIIALIIAIGFFLRMTPWSDVMTDNGVRLKGADAYFFLRQADRIGAGSFNDVDMLFCGKNGMIVEKNNLLYSYIISWVGGKDNMEFITALSAPIFSLLSIIVGFFILKELFKKNQYAVISGTAILSLTGIQFISRSYFGYGDRHVLETFLYFSTLLGIVKILNSEKYKVIWALITSGLSLLYVWAWAGASMTIILTLGILIITVFFEQKIKTLHIPLSIFTLSLSLIGLVFDDKYLIVFSILGLLAIYAIFFVEKYLGTKKLVKYSIYLTVPILAILITKFTFPVFFDELMLNLYGALVPNDVSSGISEVQPMLNIYKTFLDPRSLSFYQVFIHGLTFAGLIYMIKEKQYFWGILGLIILIASLSKIRIEYYLLIFNAVAIAYFTSKHFAVFFVSVFSSLIVAALFWMPYINGTSSMGLAYNDEDYQMAEWMKDNLPKNDLMGKDLVLARWDLGYMYGYNSNQPFYASPNLCNFKVPSQISTFNDENMAYSLLKDQGIKYIIVKPQSYVGYLSDLLKVGSELPQIAGGSNGDYIPDETYYKSMNSRLYWFNGEAKSMDSILYIDKGYVIETDNILEFEEKSDNMIKYGKGLNKTPVDLEKLKHFKLLHTVGDEYSGVKLFELID